MTPDAIFLIATYGLVPFWLLLVVLPRLSGTQFLVHSALLPLIFGCLYTYYLAVASFGGGQPEGASFGTLAGVMIFFQMPEAALAGWLHYLLFDLFIGAWEARDAQRRGMSHWLVIPCLVFTWLAGPLGLLLYIVLRAVSGKGGWRLQPADAPA
jgi:hypothetical protein